MAYISSHAAELQKEELRLLTKFRTKAASLRTQDPRLNAYSALSKAIKSMPVAYSKFCDVREQLSAIRVPPQFIDFQE